MRLWDCNTTQTWHFHTSQGNTSIYTDLNTTMHMALMRLERVLTPWKQRQSQTGLGWKGAQRSSSSSSPAKGRSIFLSLRLFSAILALPSAHQRWWAPSSLPAQPVEYDCQSLGVSRGKKMQIVKKGKQKPNWTIQATLGKADQLFQAQNIFSPSFSAHV